MSVLKEKEDSIEDLKKYFTGKVLKDLYPNDIGIYATFKSFTNQRKIRADRTISVKIKIGLNDRCKVKMVGYRPSKIINELEDYLVNSKTYSVGPERRRNLNIILEVVKEFKSQLEREPICQQEEK